MNCGRALTRPQPVPPPAVPAVEAERRFVTVLFADLSGFTALSETKDPETVRELVNACFDRLVPVIESHEGVVDQFVGDAIVALFGAPIAHEDDPARACRAALEMMPALAAVNAERRLDLGLHIGINSGMVLAGGIGSRGRQQYSVLGDAVNLASRLEDVAERGEIFVGEETMRLVRDQFEFVARGVMPFKGKSEPQPVWQLTCVKEQAPIHRRITSLSPLLGRELELALLRRVTRELSEQADGLRVVSILGEAGLGKSRLVLEWSQAEQTNPAPRPVRFLVAGCAPDSSTRAYALIADLARHLMDAHSEPTEARSAPLASLLGAGGAGQSLDASDGQALQAQYAEALRVLIAHNTVESGLVLVCEDLHWADAPSVQVLSRVLAQERNGRLLLCLTSRLEPEAPGWKLIESTEELAGASAVRLHLTPLSENDAQELLQALLPGALPDEARRLILTQAEGNPLFVEELVRMLIDREDLRREGDAWILTSELIALDVPNTLQGVLMARVDQLPPSARHILQIASVLGREFPLEVLEKVISASQ